MIPETLRLSRVTSAPAASFAVFPKAIESFGRQLPLLSREQVVAPNKNDI
jgi:hypothetical protein